MRWGPNSRDAKTNWLMMNTAPNAALVRAQISHEADAKYNAEDSVSDANGAVRLYQNSKSANDPPLTK